MLGKLDVEILLNSTLAGGVAMGASADIIVKPYYAMLGGWATGAISALGYTSIGPFLKDKIGLHDTCGVNNLHGIPGIIGGTIAAIAANQGVVRTFGARYDDIYGEIVLERSPAEQAGMQIAGVFVSLGMALLTGALTGLLTSRSFFQGPELLFDDRENFRHVKYPKINDNMAPEAQDYPSPEKRDEEEDFKNRHRDEVELRRHRSNDPIASQERHNDDD
mmetsp:Transcript_19666/g.18742  ORF Transcript_19666/g.18742 Transcript_19666/m.18742 type:complete len:220 (+) Transcript_19666:859-1518(+)